MPILNGGIKKAINKTILGIAVVGSIVGGGLVIGDLGENPKMTWQEVQALMIILNHEVEESGGAINIENAKSQRDMINKLFDRVETREIKTEQVEIKGEMLSKDDYKNLRSAVIQKAKETIND